MLRLLGGSISSQRSLKKRLRGICLNWGCIPTKSFLRSAEVLKIIKNSEKYGIKSELGQIDIREVKDLVQSPKNYPMVWYF